MPFFSAFVPVDSDISAAKNALDKLESDNVKPGQRVESFWIGPVLSVNGQSGLLVTINVQLPP